MTTISAVEVVMSRAHYVGTGHDAAAEEGVYWKAEDENKGRGAGMNVAEEVLQTLDMEEDRMTRGRVLEVG